MQPVSSSSLSFPQIEVADDVMDLTSNSNASSSSSSSSSIVSTSSGTKRTLQDPEEANSKRTRSFKTLAEALDTDFFKVIMEEYFTLHDWMVIERANKQFRSLVERSRHKWLNEKDAALSIFSKGEPLLSFLQRSFSSSEINVMRIKCLNIYAIKFENENLLTEFAKLIKRSQIEHLIGGLDKESLRVMGAVLARQQPLASAHDQEEKKEEKEERLKKLRIVTMQAKQQDRTRFKSNWNIFNEGIDQAAFVNFAKAFAPSTSIRVLNFHSIQRMNQGLNEACIDALAVIVLKIINIEVLNLVHNTFKAEQIEIFSRTISQQSLIQNGSSITNLANLDLFMGLKSNVGVPFEGFLNNFRGLTNLNLSSNGLDLASMQAVINFLKLPSSLKELSLSGNRMSAQLMKEFSICVRTMPLLTSLSLSGCFKAKVDAVKGDPQVLHFLNQVLREAKALKKLDLSKNTLYNEGLTLLLPELLELTKLDELNLADNLITEVGLTTLFVSLKEATKSGNRIRLPCLIKLDLSHNFIQSVDFLLNAAQFLESSYIFFEKILLKSVFKDKESTFEENPINYSEIKILVRSAFTKIKIFLDNFSPDPV